MWWAIILIIVVVIIGGILGGNYEFKKKQDRAESLKKRLFEIDNFTISKQIDGFGGFYIFAIDEKNEKVGLITESEKTVVNFSDIIGVELIEDGNTILRKSTTRTIGGAIVGGIIAGGAGAIVGGLSGNSKKKGKVSSLAVKILLRNLDKPTLFIKCFDSQTMTTEHKNSLETEGKIESYIYQTGKKNAEEIKDLVSVIIDRTDSKTVLTPQAIASKSENSIADELLKLSELKDKGILSEDEFVVQKNKILNK